MVGKNNKKVQDQKNAPKVTRYGLRKMSFGVASVALGSLLFVGPTPTTVSAAEVDATEEVVAIAEDLSINYYNPDGSLSFNVGWGTVYSREELEAVAKEQAAGFVEEKGDFTTEWDGNNFNVYFQGVAETPVTNDYSISFRVKNAAGEYEEFSSYNYTGMTEEGMDEIATMLADGQVEYNGVYSMTKVDNDWVYYFEGLEVEAPATEDYTLTFEVKNADGTVDLIQIADYVDMTKDEMVEISAIIAEDYKATYGDYTIVEDGNHWTFTYEGIAEVPVTNDYSISFRAKNAEGEYEEFITYNYEGMTEEDMDEIATMLADGQVEYHGVYSMTKVDNDWVYYFEGLEVEAPATEDYTLTFEVKNADGTVDLIQIADYVDMTKDEMVEISAIIAEDYKATYGDYTIVEDGNHWTFTYEGLEAEEVKEDFTLSFRVKDENGNYNEVASYVYENLTRAEFEEIANVLAEVDSEAYGVYSFASVDNDYTFYFEGLAVEEVKEDYTLTFEVMNPDGTVTFIQESEYVNMTRDQMLEISALIAEGNKATYGDYTIVEDGNHWTFTYEGLEAEEVKEDFTLSFRVKDENGNYNEVASYVYENLTRAEFEEIANILAEVDSEAYGIYSYTIVDNAYVYYFEGTESETPVGEDFTLTFQVKNPDGTITFIQESEYVNMTRDQMVEISAIIAEGNKATYGDYTIVENGNHWTFTYEGLEAEEVREDFTLSFRVKDENGNYNEVASYVYENLTRAEFEEIANILAEVDSEAYGIYSYTIVDNAYVYYFEGLGSETPVTEDYTLTFQVKNPDGTITFIQESEYVNMTRDQMVEISALIAEGNKATYGDYTIVENGNHWIFTYEGLGEEVPVGNDYFLSFQVKNEDGVYVEFNTYNYENMTEEEMMELAIALADFQTEFHGSYELVKDGNNWTFYFEGLKNSIPWIPLEPSTPIKPDVPLTPLEPSTPIKPDVPLTPLEPSTPIVPETPETPEVPEVPETPETPETPEVPEVPETPEMPETPATPEKPNDSAETEGEKLPVTSTAVWSLGLAGLVSVVGGAGAEAIRRKKK